MSSLPSPSFTYYDVNGARIGIGANSADSFRDSLQQCKFSKADLVKIITNTAVCSLFDLECSYTFESEQSLSSSLALLDNSFCHCSIIETDQVLHTEVWSLFKTAIQKSTRNLSICADVGLVKVLLDKMLSSHSLTDVLMDLFTEILVIIVPQSISTTELKIIINYLQSPLKSVTSWPQKSNNLLTVLRQTPFQIGPTEFFDFPAFDNSFIAIPPITKWPCTNGFTFTTWLRSDPVSDIREDKDKPYIYCFRTSKGQGYSAHFVGSCLIVTVIKSKNKGYQYSVNFEFKPRTWYMLTLVHIYSRWRNGEIKCYVNGQLVTTVEVNWYVKSGYEIYDKCYLGWAPQTDKEDTVRRYFCGQMATVYLLSSAMAQSQVEALHQLGPCYTGLFNEQSDTDVCLSEFYNNAIFGQGNLSFEVVFSYSARASQCQICFFSASCSTVKSRDASNTYFAHSPHAQLQGDVKAVTTQPIYHSLHSIGGVQILFPLFSQVGLLPDVDREGSLSFAAETLLEMLFNLMMRSSQIRQQMVQLKGLMIIGHYFVKNSHKVLSMTLLEQIIGLSNYFIHIRSEALLKHTIDFLLLNANLWISAPVNIQVRLFTYLSTDFAVNCPLFKLSRIRRVSTVLQLLHMLKFYYWVTNPQAKSGVIPKGLDSSNTIAPRPNQNDIMTIRSLILLFLKAVITVDASFMDEEHMQSLLNYLTTLHEEENVHDVLSLLLSITANSPKLTCQALDRKYAVRALFKVMASPSERIRIKAVKILIYYMANIPYKRKIDIMVSYGLYELIGQRLMLHCEEISLPTYNVMFEFCTEQTGPLIMENKHAEIDSTTPLVNALGLKSIANMISCSRKTLNVFEIKKKFITDMILLFNHNRENRRRLLQCSVWQDWVFSLLHIYPANDREKQITEMVLVLFKILLHHAVKFEYGGWRVWIDTLSIAHFKVAIENYRRSVLGIGHKPQTATTSLSSSHHSKTDSTCSTSLKIEDVSQGEKVVDNNQNSSQTKDKSVAAEFATIDVKEEPTDTDLEGDGTVCVSSGDVQEDVAKMQAQVFLEHVIEKVETNVSEKSNDSLKVLGLPESTIGLPANDTEEADSNFKEEPHGDSPQSLSKTQVPKSCSESEIHSKEVRFSSSVESEPSKNTKTTDVNGSASKANSEIPRPILKKRVAIGQKQTKEDAISDGKKHTRKLFKIPPFQWTHLVKRLLSDLIFSIETDVQVWRSQSNKSLVEFLNSAENSIFLHNTVHVISQLSDMILYSSGGLVSLLHSATSQSQENITTRNGLQFDESFSFVHRLLNLADVFVYSASPRFSSLETEKRMNPGGILRQCLRLIFWAALKNCVECRYKFTRQLIAYETDSRDDEITNDVMNSALQYQAINDLTRLLQDIDISRIKAAIYRETDDIKQSHAVALSSVYFLTLLMVGRYQDILEPQKVERSPFCKELMDKSAHSSSPTMGAQNSNDSTAKNQVEDADSNDIDEDEDEKNSKSNADKFEDVDLGTPIYEADDIASSTIQSRKQNTNKLSATRSVSWSGSAEKQSSMDGAANSDGATEDLGLGIGTNMDLTTVSPQGKLAEEGSNVKSDGNIDQLNFATNLKFNQVTMGNNISKYLENSLYGTGHVLRDLFLDFSHYLSKTLTGSHGQELLQEGLTIMKNSNSAIELVMMLCSQEWQKAIQKHAGGAFLNLENEGRVISTLTADHLIRVADEANEILNREYQDQMARQSEFEARCATHLADRREEETMCDRLIVASRRRDAITATKSVQKILSSTLSQCLWGDIQRAVEVSQNFYKIDTWEDNLRRRRRLVLNPLGSSHPDATLKVEDDNDLVIKDSSGVSANVLGDIKVGPVADSKFDDDKGLGSGQGSESEAENGDCESLEENDAESHAINIPSTTNPVKFQSHECLLIHPCVTSIGVLSITTNEIIFDIDEENSLFKKLDPGLIAYCDLTHIKIPFTDIRAVFSRRYLLKNTAIEIFIVTRCAIMINLPDLAAVKQVVSLLPRVGIGTKFGAPRNRRYSMASGRALYRLTNMTDKWQKREISNFQYLMFLNTIGGRTYNDLNQYPVFPWIIKDYDSEELNLKSPATFRDLSKPVGAQTPQRAQSFKNKFDRWESDAIPPFHYGTHYSTQGFVLNWLVRCEPFTTMFLNFQGGTFDHPDRTFHSVKQAWTNCQRDTSDVKELIPELFYLPEMLRNNNNLRFGKLENDQVVNDVILPNWAATPEDFIRKHRMALESEFVSCQLNHWIDLIFGYKQRGPEAEKALNVFYHLTYEGAIDFDSIKDPTMLEALRAQIRSFGTTPVQLLAEPHPQRCSIIVLNPQLFKELGEASSCEGYNVKFLSNSPIVHISANTHVSATSPACVAIAENLSYSINKWNNSPAVSHLVKPQSESENSQTLSRPLQLDTLQMNVSLHNTNYTGRKLSPDLMDTHFKVQKNSFVVTSDNTFALVCGFWDRSLRVFNLESGKLVQVVFGHYGVVTCVAETECKSGANCHVVSGSSDNTLLVWEWDSRYQCIMGEKTIPGEYPMAKAILMGHSSCVNCVSVSSELGIVVSTSSISHILVHLLNGEFVRRITLPDNNTTCPSKLSLSTCNITNVLLNPSTGTIIAVAERTSIYVFSSGGILLAHKTGFSANKINDLITTIDGAYIIVGGDKALLHIYRSHNLELVHKFDVKVEPDRSSGVIGDLHLSVKSVELSWDNKNVIAGLSNGSVWVSVVNFTKWYPEYCEVEVKLDSQTNEGSNQNNTSNNSSQVPALSSSVNTATAEPPQNNVVVDRDAAVTLQISKMPESGEGSNDDTMTVVAQSHDNSIISDNTQSRAEIPVAEVENSTSQSSVPSKDKDTATESVLNDGTCEQLENNHDVQDDNRDMSQMEETPNVHDSPSDTSKPVEQQASPSTDETCKSEEPAVVDA